MAGHNQQFERAILAPYIGNGYPRPEQQDCTMSRAVAMGLPASLDSLGAALRCDITKDKDGHRLMLQMCKPRDVAADGTITWWEDEERLERLGAYCERDVDSECAVDDHLPPLSPREHRVWELDQHINDRGVALDMPMVHKALAVVAAASKRADREIWKLTNGAVKKATETGKIVAWITAQGVPCDSIAKDEHEDLLVGADLFDKPLVEQVVRLRAASAKAFKFSAMSDAVCRDGRVRDSLKYSATVQKRWAGAGVQFHNMKRIDTDEDSAAVRAAVDLLHQDLSPDATADMLEFMFDAPLDVLSMCARACVIAPPGKKLMGGDFSNIEGRINAWLAGEHWKLEAFAAYDRGEGPDLYKVTAGSIIGIPTEEVSKAQRQEQGKVPELACLGPDTQVFTDTGLKRIVDVTVQDKLWDGSRWVTHAGLVHKGFRQVQELFGTWLTSDHQVRVGQTWAEAGKVASGPYLSAQALATGSASLQSLATSSGKPEACTAYWSDVPAELMNTAFTSPICAGENQPAAVAARPNKQAFGENLSSLTQTSFPTRLTAAGSLIEFPLVSLGAGQGTLRREQKTMLHGGYAYTAPGQKACKAGENSCATSLPWSVGISRIWKWIALKWTGTTSRAISGSLPNRRTCSTSDPSKKCSSVLMRWSDVYDIAHAGPDNCFTIQTNSGPLIVHNCGYQGSLGAFKKMGAKYGVRLPDSRIREIVAGWRASNPAIAASWYELQNGAIEAVGAPGCVISVLGGRVKYTCTKDKSFLFCMLPNGGVISYAAPSLAWKTKVMVIDGDEIEFNRHTVSYWGQHKGWRQMDLYGGMQCAHVVSGTAREVLVDAMFRLEEAGYETVLTVHDEALSEVDAGFGSIDEYRGILLQKSKWLADVPLAATTWEGDRYDK